MKLRALLRKFSLEELRAAIRFRQSDAKREKLEAERADLQRQLAKIEAKLAKLGAGNGAAPAARKTKGRGRRKGYKLSAATRNRMRIAALKRYGKTEAPATGKRKRKPFSAETRAKMRASQQARRAKAKGTAEPKAE
jgi:hypothetical protein